MRCEDVTRDWSELTGIPAEVTVTGNVIALHPEIEVALLRIAQEALANVARHAGASRAGLTLSFMGDVVTLDVRDDGVGFTVARAGRHAPGTGFGLAGMRQRVARVAGSLAIESEPGSGTAMSARVPAIAAGSAATIRAMSPIRLLIVDDHPVVRDGSAGCSPATRISRSWARPRTARRRSRSPARSGRTSSSWTCGCQASAARPRSVARRAGLDARVLVLTTYDTDRDVVPALEAGATGYLLKDAPREELVRAIRAAARGESSRRPSRRGSSASCASPSRRR